MAGINQSYSKFIEELTGPGTAEKVIKKSFQNYPAESVASTALLSYLVNKYIKKWRNIEKEKKELEEAVERLTNNYREKE